MSSQLIVLRLTPHPIRHPLRKTEPILIKCLKSPSKITLSLVLDTLISLKGKPFGDGEEGRRGGPKAHTVIHMSIETHFHQEYQVIFVP